MKKEEAKELLRKSALRVTAPRLAVLRVLSAATNPLAHTEVLKRLGESDWDQATIYRNLVKLRDVGLVYVVNRADGIDRYALENLSEDNHHHPHFICEGCGRYECLPQFAGVPLASDHHWAASLQNATLHLRGECPQCISTHSESIK